MDIVLPREPNLVEILVDGTIVNMFLSWRPHCTTVGSMTGW